jgi:hypothetical protein
MNTDKNSQDKSEHFLHKNDEHFNAKQSHLTKIFSTLIYFIYECRIIN